MHITGGTSPPTPSISPHSHPHSAASFYLLISPVDSHCYTISAVIGYMRLLLCRRSRGGLKNNNNNYNMEMRSRVWVTEREEEEQSSSCGRAHQCSFSLTSVQETESMPETYQLGSVAYFRYLQFIYQWRAVTVCDFCTWPMWPQNLHLSVDLGILF